MITVAGFVSDAADALGLSDVVNQAAARAGTAASGAVAAAGSGVLVQANQIASQQRAALARDVADATTGAAIKFAAAAAAVILLAAGTYVIVKRRA